MKKNYIKPVSKTVIPELAVGAMKVVASIEEIDYGGEDEDGLDGQAPERPEDLMNDQKKNTYSLW